MVEDRLDFALTLGMLITTAVAIAGGFEVGDVFTGEVIRKDVDGKKIVLNIKPCESEQYPVTIKEPYHLTDLGDATCPGDRGRKYHKVQVEQLPPSPKENPEKEPPKEHPEKERPETALE